MAISLPHYTVLRDMYAQGMLPQRAAILELGEANWYTIGQAVVIREDIERFVTDPARREALLSRLDAAVADQSWHQLFLIAKVVYELFFQPVEMQAIDF